MLFLCFLAGAMGSAGWLLFWAVMGLFFSSRAGVWFVAPGLAAALGHPEVGAVAVLVSWVFLFFAYAEKVSRREEAREANRALLRRAQAQLQRTRDRIDGLVR